MQQGIHPDGKAMNLGQLGDWPAAMAVTARVGWLLISNHSGRQVMARGT